MDAKEIKSSLKLAKEAIRDKNYKTVIKLCKLILKSDKSNYNAWVFLGIATLETNQLEQSEAAFQKAIDISPDQILAWQGLCNFYEKQENRGKLICTLFKLVKLLDKDTKKQSEILDKLTNLVKETEDKKEIVKVLELQLEIAVEGTEEKNVIWKQIFQELQHEKKLDSHLEDLHHTAFIKVIKQPTFSEDDCQRIIKIYIEPLFQDGQMEKAVILANHICQKYPHSRSSLEFLSKAALHLYMKTGNVMKEVKEIIEMANQNISDWLCHFLCGLLSLHAKDYLYAIQELKQGVEKKENCYEGWYLLAKIQLLLHLYLDAEKSSKTGLRVAVNSNAPSDVIGQFYLLLGKALTGQKVWDTAVKAFDKCSEYMGRTSELLKAFCLTLLKIGQLEKAEQICADLKTDLTQKAAVLQLEGYALLLRKQYSGALEKLRQSVSLEESSFTLHLIGIVLWETEEKKKAFKIFLKAAELDPFFSKNFLY